MSGSSPSLLAAPAPSPAWQCDAPLRIGDLAERAGVSVRSLRYYETRGLLASARTTGGQRRYATDAVERVLLIQRLFGAGLTSGDVVELLPCIVSGTTTPAMVERLERERDRIGAQVRELAATRDRLSQVLVEARARVVR
jgi:DNA-binding transcriptional MerR regulator